LPQRVGKTPAPPTDIAILETPKTADLKMADGTLVDKPRIYIGRNEGSKPVTLLGYGTWGVGVGQRSPQIPYGPGRSMGSGLVHIPNEQDRIDVPYNPTEGQAKGRSERGASGDSGAGSWQD